MIYKLRKALLLLFVFVATIAASQRLRFKYITNSEGLSTNYVRCVMKDRYDFLWIGTQDGLNKYDGLGIKVFKHQPGDSNSLPGSEIFALQMVRNDLIVVGTANGLCFFNPLQERFQQPKSRDKRLTGPVKSIFAIDSLTILVGTNEGLFTVDLQTGKVLKSHAKTKLEPLCIQRFNKQMYFGTQGQGLWRLSETGACEKIPCTVGGADGEEVTVVSSLVPYGNELLIGTRGQGVLRMLPGGQINDRILFGGEENTRYVNGLREKNGKLYAGTAGGFVVYDLKDKNPIVYDRLDKPTFSINSKVVSCIDVDEENNIWLGTELGGVNFSTQA